MGEDGSGVGRLLIIGGAEDKEGDMIILRRFVREAGGNEARVVILTCATEDPEGVGQKYRAIFQELGCAEVQVLDITSREGAGQEGTCRLLTNSTGIFLSGGDQLRLTSLLGGTKAQQAMREAFERGAIVAGTSAGASAMSAVMVVGGVDDDAPKKRTVSLAPGLGLLNGVVIDQHFAQRGRIGRLLAAVAQNPDILGVGLDEDTSILVEPGKGFEVVGSQTVTILDGRKLVQINASEQAADEPLALSPVNLHILPHGWYFHFKHRSAVYQPNTSRRARKA